MRYGRKKLRKICGAIKKNGIPCQCKKLYRGQKCRFHGGLSLTNEDRDRITRETGRVFQKRNRICGELRGQSLNAGS